MFLKIAYIMILKVTNQIMLNNNLHRNTQLYKDRKDWVRYTKVKQALFEKNVTIHLGAMST